MKTVLVGYSDRDSVRPGDEIAFKVSCEHVDRFRADIVRLRCPDTGPEGPGYLETEIAAGCSGEYAARTQPIVTGSYVRVPAAGPIAALESFTVLAAIWSTRPGAGRQAILGTWDPGTRSGWGLALDESGRLSFVSGDGTSQYVWAIETPVPARRWHLAAASFDAAAGCVTIHQVPLTEHRISDDKTRRATAPARISANTGAFYIAASVCEQRTAEHYDGKIDRPRLFAGVLDMDALHAALLDPMPTSLRDSLVAAWNFDCDVDTDRVTDNGPHRLHGVAVNLPARGQTGFNWSGREHCWRHARSEYGAIHFHSDDLYDAGWQTDFTLKVGADMKSGIYAARLRAKEAEFYVPFYVRPAEGKRSADVLFLLPTATYLAYANNRGRILSPVTDALIGKLTVVDETDLLIVERPEYGLSTYDAHRDGSSVNYSSRLRPVSNHRPKDSDMGMAYNNFAPDLLVVDWLEHIGVSYDVLTDEDLHYEGMRALDGYRVVVTGTHPEYASLQMLETLEQFTRTGGRLMYLGGNGFYWRVAFREDKPGCIELRRAQVNSARWNPGLGQYYHSFSGEHGGLWRDLGRAPQGLCGVGFVSQGFDSSSYYRRTKASRDPRAEFIFKGVNDDILGDFGLLRGGAAGIEIDRVDERYGTPDHALVVAHSEGHTNVYEAFEDVIAMGQTLPDDRPPLRADMVFFECPGGGAVFSVGSIAYAGSLSHDEYDNNINTLTVNVLERFRDPKPFRMPTATD